MLLEVSWPARCLRLASLSAQAQEQDAIKFGVADEPYPPFASKDASGKWVGFEMDLVDAVCAEMKAKCELVPVAWEGIIPALQAKKIDVIWASMLITEKRKQIIDFSDKYYDTPHMFIGPKSVKVDTCPETGICRGLDERQGDRCADFDGARESMQRRHSATSPRSGLTTSRIM